MPSTSTTLALSGAAGLFLATVSVAPASAEPEIVVEPVHYADQASYGDLLKDVRRADRPGEAKRYKAGLDIDRVVGSMTSDDSAATFEIQVKKLKQKDLETYENQGVGVYDTDLRIIAYLNTGGRVEISFSPIGGPYVPPGPVTPNTMVWESDDDKMPEQLTCPDHDDASGPALQQEADLAENAITFTVATDCWTDDVYGARIGARTGFTKKGKPFYDDLVSEDSDGKTGWMRLVPSDELPPQD